jgi:glutathione S-transferase
MQLIGMLDSPYVRRVAISMKLMDLSFEHRPVSVFRQFDLFRELNPVVKAPTLLCDDGTLLMDSTLILQHLEDLVPAQRRLLPAQASPKRDALRLVGLALAACDLCVRMIYEREQRPPEKRHDPWYARTLAQALAAFDALEVSARGASPWLQGGGGPNAADVAVAVAWRFGQHYNAALIPAGKYQALAALSGRAEALPAFASTPLA